jgi:hypothetical protein
MVRRSSNLYDSPRLRSIQRPSTCAAGGQPRLPADQSSSACMISANVGLRTKQGGRNTKQGNSTGRSMVRISRNLYDSPRLRYIQELSTCAAGGQPRLPADQSSSACMISANVDLRTKGGRKQQHKHGKNKQQLIRQPKAALYPETQHVCSRRPTTAASWPELQRLHDLRERGPAHQARRQKHNSTVKW